MSRRLLTIGHSYVVALNRRLAHEMSREGGSRWEVTAVAPRFLYGDLRPVELERFEGERCALEAVDAHWTKRLHVMFYGRRLRALLAQGWDLVHCWEEPYVLSGAQIAAWTPKRVPFVFWTYQNIAKKYPPPFSWFERYCLKRCAAWAACGETVRQTLEPRGYASKPHCVAPLGVDMDCFRPGPPDLRAKIGWSEDGPPVLGYLGRFVPEKGLTLLMETLDRVSSPWRALFVGVGPMETALRKWGDRYPGRVKIATGVTHDQVPAHLQAMDFLCAPSQTTPRWREQFGRMIVEAFGCGVPVVGSDSGEIPYVIGDAGLVAGEQDCDAWLRAISSLLENPMKRKDLGARGRERAANKYAWPVVARRYLEFFDEIVDTKPARDS